MKNNPTLISFLFGFVLLSSCKVNKYLAEDELLYKATKIEFVYPKKIEKKKKLAADLNSIAVPVPNSGLFKSRLWLYYKMGELQKEKGFKYWVKNKLGEAPALYTPQQAERNRLQMKKYMRDYGYFGTEVTVDTKVLKKSVEVTYHVGSRGQYKLRKVYFPSDTTSIGQLVKQQQEQSFLKPGKPYQKLHLDNERNRLASIAVNEGYMDFNPNYFYYFVDTIQGTLQTDLYITYAAPLDSSTQERFQLDQTNVFPNFDLADETGAAFRDTVKANPSLNIIQNYEILRPRLIDRLILQDKGSIYNKRLQDASINHLLDLGIFKFVNIKYERKRVDGQMLLDRFFYLTPDLPESAGVEFELNNRTGNYLGTAANLSYLHKNLFRGGEELRLVLSGGVENQLSNRENIINTAEINFELGLSVPYFILPFLKKIHSGFFVPRTRLIGSTNFEWRSGFFRVNSQNLKFGYEWRETQSKSHNIYPLNLRRLSVSNTTPEFDSLLSENPRLRNSFEDVFIAGLEYTFVFTNQKPGRQNYLFFRGDVDLAGNLLYGFNKAFNNRKDPPYSLFRLPFSQFSKWSADMRYYYNLPKSTLVSRIAGGMALAYGNSEVVPYVEQFYVGGANSIRAFPIRGIGPGSTVNSPVSSNQVTQQFLDQTGDVKLEMNLEYRFNLYSYLKGAVFLDAGNVWLLNEETGSESKFRFNSFWRELALGTGVGLRIDLDFFVIRLDIAFPLRKPFPDEGFQWTFNQLQFGNKQWRKDNLVWDLAIGYPF